VLAWDHNWIPKGSQGKKSPDGRPFSQFFFSMPQRQWSSVRLSHSWSSWARFQKLFWINSVFNAAGVANPLLWGPGLILGLLVNRFAQKSTACWVWLAGVVWIVYGVLAALYSHHARFAGICSPLDSIRKGFFSLAAGYCGDGSNGALSTVPTFSSIAYSLGAWVALRFGGSRESTLP